MLNLNRTHHENYNTKPNRSDDNLPGMREPGYAEDGEAHHPHQQHYRRAVSRLPELSTMQAYATIAAEYRNAAIGPEGIVLRGAKNG